MVFLMEKINSVRLSLLAVVLLAGAVALSGCVSSGQPADSGSGEGVRQAGAGNRMGFGPGGNLTPEQRQQMFEERTRLAAEACKGKAEGDSCAMQDQRGNTTGACATRNGTLACGFGNGTWQGRPNRPGATPAAAG